MQFRKNNEFYLVHNLNIGIDKKFNYDLSAKNLKNKHFNLHVVKTLCLKFAIKIVSMLNYSLKQSELKFIVIDLHAAL